MPSLVALRNFDVSLRQRQQLGTEMGPGHGWNLDLLDNGFERIARCDVAVVVRSPQDKSLCCKQLQPAPSRFGGDALHHESRIDSRGAANVAAGLMQGASL